MNRNELTPKYRTTHSPAGAGPHCLMLGSVLVTTVIAGDRTGGDFSLVELTGPRGSGPGPHLDLWRETFYVLDGELTFRVEEEGAVRAIVARRGDAVSIPRGVAHAFSVTSAEPARYLITSTPAGIDAFFADAGEPIAEAVRPEVPRPFDRERLQAAFDRHGLTRHSFAENGSAPAQLDANQRTRGQAAR